MESHTAGSAVGVERKKVTASWVVVIGLKIEGRARWCKLLTVNTMIFSSKCVLQSELISAIFADPKRKDPNQVAHTDNEVS